MRLTFCASCFWRNIDCNFTSLIIIRVRHLITLTPSRVNCLATDDNRGRSILITLALVLSSSTSIRINTTINLQSINLLCFACCSCLIVFVHQNISHNGSITCTDIRFVGCDSCLIQRRSKGRDSNSDEDCDDCNNNQHFHERKALLILHLTHFVHHRNHSPIH